MKSSLGKKQFEVGNFLFKLILKFLKISKIGLLKKIKNKKKWIKLMLILRKQKIDND